MINRWVLATPGGRMFIFRWLSVVLIVLAIMLLGADLVATLEKHVLVIRSLQDVIMLFSYDTKAALISHFPQQIVAAGNIILDSPGWIVFAIIAFIFGIIAPSSKAVRPLPPPPPIPR
jgi:hypothetical protein